MTVLRGAPEEAEALDFIAAAGDWPVNDAFSCETRARLWD